MTLPDNALVIGGGTGLVLLVAFFLFIKNYCDKKIATGQKSLRKRLVKDINKLNMRHGEEMIAEREHRHRVAHSRRRYEEPDDDDSVAEVGGMRGDEDYADYDGETEE